MKPEELNSELGNIDLFLLDQILKGRFKQDMKILDVGCGEGRNLLYFLKNNYNVFALDTNPSAIKMIRLHARTLKSNWKEDQLLVGDISQMSFPDSFFDRIICFSVLHFANGRKEFQKMITGLVRILKKGGMMFLKMESTKGIENMFIIQPDGSYKMKEGSRRYLFSEEDTEWLTKQLKLEFAEPINYTIIGNQKSFANLVLKLQE